MMLSMATNCTEKRDTFFLNLSAFIVSYSKNIWLLHGENIINIVCTNVYTIEKRAMNVAQPRATPVQSMCVMRARMQKITKYFIKNSIVCFVRNLKSAEISKFVTNGIKVITLCYLK